MLQEMKSRPPITSLKRSTTNKPKKKQPAKKKRPPPPYARRIRVPTPDRRTSSEYQKTRNLGEPPLRLIARDNMAGHRPSARSKKVRQALLGVCGKINRGEERLQIIRNKKRKKIFAERNELNGGRAVLTTCFLKTKGDR